VSLDAYVHCDCFERGCLRSAPPAGCNPSIASDGGLDCGSDNPDVQIAFDGWWYAQACAHESGVLVSHRIGNIALVALLRTELSRWPQRFPMLLERVIYNGVHCGDFIPATEVSALAREVEAIASVRCDEPEKDAFVRGFESQMRELVIASLTVGKPIVF
jgi:hypothetical protein